MIRNQQHLHALIASPRGFCAGVERAVKIVERALEKWGAPVYVRHAIVHNRTVVERLQSLGAVFVSELDQCPDHRPVIFSAHGVPAHVPQQARMRNLKYVDATCPLVSKVHAEAKNLSRTNAHILLIGHHGHPEVIGTMGQIPEHSISLIQTLQDAENISPPKGPLACLTQTTLSIDDAAQILAVLKRRFPYLQTPKTANICYATTNRQNAVRTIAKRSDLVLIIGSDTSSNARRLAELARKIGSKNAHLISGPKQIHWPWFKNVKTFGLSAGASTPETLVTQSIAACRAKFPKLTLEEVQIETETISFRLPRELETANP